MNNRKGFTRRIVARYSLYRIQTRYLKNKIIENFRPVLTQKKKKTTSSTFTQIYKVITEYQILKADIAQWPLFILQPSESLHSAILWNSWCVAG